MREGFERLLLHDGLQGVYGRDVHRGGWVGRLLYQRVHIRDGAVRDRGN
jgi:hypothetical protein